jgi:predicted DNA-binding transcriptional regulator AlpA
MERFGVSKLGGAYGSLSKFDVDRHPEIMSTGLEIARGWPNSFQALLEDLGATSGLGQWGIEQVYGYLYLWVKALPDNPFGQTVRSEMFSYIAQGRFVHGRSIVAGYASNDTMTVAEAADFCGLGSATISRYLRALGQFPQRTKRGSPILVERRIVEDLKAQLDGTFQLGDLPSILALDPTQVKALIKAGLIKPMELATKAGKARRLFEREHIETVLMRLRGEAPVLEAIPSELKPLAHSCRHAKLGGLPVACRLILEGKVRVQAVLRSAIGLAGLFIDPDDLRKVRRAEAGAALHVRDAARILGLHQETIWSLVHQGLLPAVKLDSQRYGIALLDVKEFDRQYVSATAIARDLATLPRYLNPALHLIGINPALSSQKDGRCRVSIYRRTELPEDLPAWWATFQNDSK